MLIVRKRYQLSIDNFSNEMNRCICRGKNSLGKSDFVIHTPVTGAVRSFGLPVLMNNG